MLVNSTRARMSRAAIRAQSSGTDCAVKSRIISFSPPANAGQRPNVWRKRSAGRRSIDALRRRYESLPTAPRQCKGAEVKPSVKRLLTAVAQLIPARRGLRQRRGDGARERKFLQMRGVGRSRGGEHDDDQGQGQRRDQELRVTEVHLDELRIERGGEQQGDDEQRGDRRSQRRYRLRDQVEDHVPPACSEPDDAR